jgi:hypothetical protein
VREYKPILVFLSETRQNKVVVEGICRRLGFANCLPVSVQGKGGGLALFVCNSVKIDLLSYGDHHIDVTVMEQCGIKFRSTFVYGEPRPQDRPEFWKLLRRIKNVSSEPWLMAGDFNEALFQSEHFSMRRRSESLMQDFRDTLNSCNLHDLGFYGTPWTYDNKQVGNKNVRVRLDRAVACPAWLTMFPFSSVQHITSSRSDHCPIVINLERDQTKLIKSATRYEAMWEREASLFECVDEAWLNYKTATNLDDIQHKLAHTMTSLCRWSKTKFESVNREIKELKRKLERLQNQNYKRNQDEIRSTSARLDEILYREEVMRRQRSRIQWLKEGDQNTRFFHRKASGRASKNRIRKLKKEMVLRLLSKRSS